MPLLLGNRFFLGYLQAECQGQLLALMKEREREREGPVNAGVL